MRGRLVTFPRQAGTAGVHGPESDVEIPYRGNQVADLPSFLEGTWQQVSEHDARRSGGSQLRDLFDQVNSG